MLTERDWASTAPWIDDPSANIVETLDRHRLPYDQDDIERLEFWRRNGFVILKRAASHQAVDALLNDIEWAMAHAKSLDIGVEVLGRHVPIGDVTSGDLAREGTKLNSIHAFSKAAINLSLSPSIQHFLRLIFLQPAAALQSLTFWRGSQQPAHIDYPYVRTQTRLAEMAASWIALEDVRPDSGPLIYYPGSHRVEKSGFFDWGGGSILMEPDSTSTPEEFSRYLDQRMREVGIAPVSFCPEKGDALIWHANLVHAGSAIANPLSTRKSYVTHYTSVGAYPVDFRPAHPIEGKNQFSGPLGTVWEYPWDAAKPKLPSWRAL